MRLKSMMEANTIVSTENEKKFKKKKNQSDLDPNTD
jgi:hypothetical protein